ncbi:hypothetical protein [Deinococcus multiflagellatus]|uniref:Uncharacterized protein n=1 Tax=Deinococcus multiflagellatus TaxID=1656887 RepID=A0ABW1ZNL5_9DEIO|nr:hypothetical protein [Deinococcus multiflagellatus]MBZ9715626.1 hypothetical protein [Deinococcus multiflagellatus]
MSLKRFLPLATARITRDRAALTGTYTLRDLQAWVHEAAAPEQPLAAWQRNQQGADRNGMRRIALRLADAGLIEPIQSPRTVSFRVVQDTEVVGESRPAKPAAIRLL